MSTQEGFGRLLNDLAQDPGAFADRIVTTSPDVTVSTNLGPWVNRRGLFDRRCRADLFREEAVASTQKWEMSPAGQHIELGIAENNLFLLLAALGLAGPLFGARLLPIGTLYDPFIGRGLDALNYACYQGARFLLVATPSGLSLAPEGGAHQSVITPLIGLGQPGLTAFEPAFVDELAAILAWSLRHIQDDDGGSVYLRLSTRPIDQPKREMTPELRGAVVRGGYWLVPPGPEAELAIVCSGVVTPEAIEAHAQIREDIPGAGLLVVTSAGRLHADWLAATRARTEGDADARSHVERLLAALSPGAALVTVLDGHPAALSWLGAVARHRVVALGVDRFGQSGDIPDLYREYGLDAQAIVAAAARACLDQSADLDRCPRSADGRLTRERRGVPCHADRDPDAAPDRHDDRGGRRRLAEAGGGAGAGRRGHRRDRGRQDDRGPGGPRGRHARQDRGTGGVREGRGGRGPGRSAPAGETAAPPPGACGRGPITPRRATATWPGPPTAADPAEADPTRPGRWIEPAMALLRRCQGQPAGPEHGLAGRARSLLPPRQRAAGPGHQGGRPAALGVRARPRGPVAGSPWPRDGPGASLGRGALRRGPPLADAPGHRPAARRIEADDPPLLPGGELPDRRPAPVAGRAPGEWRRGAEALDQRLRDPRRGPGPSEVPEANASWTDAATRRYRRVDLAVAVATESGLIAPIVRDADRKGLAELAAEVRDLAARARAGRLRPEEYQGGTFTVSNLGMYGIDELYAIVNPPQAGILGLGAAEPRPVVRDGSVVVATMMTCTLSADHRVLDGAAGRGSCRPSRR